MEEDIISTTAYISNLNQPEQPFRAEIRARILVVTGPYDEELDHCEVLTEFCYN